MSVTLMTLHHGVCRRLEAVILNLDESGELTTFWLVRLACGLTQVGIWKRSYFVLVRSAQVAIKAIIAASAVGSLAAAPLPAMAGDVFTYGRPAIIAERERLFEVMQLICS
jgi:hypothetical protein